MEAEPTNPRLKQLIDSGFKQCSVYHWRTPRRGNCSDSTPHTVIIVSDSIVSYINHTTQGTYARSWKTSIISSAVVLKITSSHWYELHPRFRVVGMLTVLQLTNRPVVPALGRSDGLTSRRHTNNAGIQHRNVLHSALHWQTSTLPRQHVQIQSFLCLFIILLFSKHIGICPCQAPGSSNATHGITIDSLEETMNIYCAFTHPRFTSKTVVALINDLQVVLDKLGDGSCGRLDPEMLRLVASELWKFIVPGAIDSDICAASSSTPSGRRNVPWVFDKYRERAFGFLTIEVFTSHVVHANKKTKTKNQIIFCIHMTT